MSEFFERTCNHIFNIKNMKLSDMTLFNDLSIFSQFWNEFARSRIMPELDKGIKKQRLIFVQELKK